MLAPRPSNLPSTRPQAERRRRRRRPKAEGVVRGFRSGTKIASVVVVSMARNNSFRRSRDGVLHRSWKKQYKGRKQTDEISAMKKKMGMEKVALPAASQALVPGAKGWPQNSLSPSRHSPVLRLAVFRFLVPGEGEARLAGGAVASTVGPCSEQGVPALAEG